MNAQFYASSIVMIFRNFCSDDIISKKTVINMVKKIIERYLSFVQLLRTYIFCLTLLLILINPISNDKKRIIAAYILFGYINYYKITEQLFDK